MVLNLRQKYSSFIDSSTPNYLTYQVIIKYLHRLAYKINNKVF